MSRRTASMVALLAVVGLVVSITGAWASTGSGPPLSNTEPGARSEAAVTRTPAILGSPDTAEPGQPPERAGLATEPTPQSAQSSRQGGDSRPPAIGRSSASLQDVAAAAAPVRPVRVRVGAVAIDAAVRPVGVVASGQMRLPADPRVFGWYRYGPGPDARDRGSVVIAGHLDSFRFGIGPLVRLREVEVGDTVRVTPAHGKRTTYRVTRIQRFDRQGLPEHLFARSGPHRLRLITCGGAFEADAGGYQQNLVVTAVPVRR